MHFRIEIWPINISLLKYDKYHKENVGYFTQPTEHRCVAN